MKLWEKIIYFLKIRRINQQIFFLTIVTVTVPLIVISIVVYFTSVQSVKNEHQESSNLILNNLSFNIDQYLRGIEKGTLAIYMENDFQETLENWGDASSNKDPYIGLQNEKSLEKFITSINMSIDNVEGIQIYSDDQVFFSDLFSHSVIPADNMTRSHRYKKVLNAKGNTVLFGTHTPLYEPNSDQQVITTARTVNKKGSKQSLGVMFIDIRTDAIRDILSLSENSDRNFVILDNEGGVIYASNQNLMNEHMRLNEDNQSLLQSMDNDTGSFYTSVNSKKSFINYVTSPYSDWKVIQYIDQKEMTNQAEKLRLIIFILVLSSLITAALFLFILNQRVTKPIIDLSRQVEEVGKGNFHVDLDSKRQDEFGLLYEEISHMAKELQDYIERSSMLKAQQKLAQYSALKSQIHPHFLSNALETIQMKAIMNDQQDISDMIGTLGQLFRISIQSGKEVVLLEEELKHTRLYMKVQQMRFGERISYKEDFAPGSLTIPVLHFSIQPFIENAIVHGLEPKASNGIIRLKTILDEENLNIIIQDNGVGMTPNELRGLREKLAHHSDTLTEAHIGVKNVHDQIRYYFGEQYGVTIDSQLDVGTKVTISIPRK